MKGVELPINVLVIVTIAVIVLLGLVVLYFIGFNPFSGSVSLTSLKNAGCSNFSLNFNCGSRGTGGVGSPKDPQDICLPVNTYLTGDCTANNLQKLCTNYFGAATATQCRQTCGCL
jgi:hypothetical protein